MTAKHPKGRRYSPAQKQRILETAKKEKLTGEQVQKRFGIAALTFYRWRGPVRARRTGGKPGRVTLSKADAHQARRQAQEQIRRLMPKIVREEVAAYLKAVLK